MATKPPFEIDGQHFASVSALSRHFGIKQHTLRYRLKKCWSLEKAVRQPVMEMVRESWEVNGVIYRPPAPETIVPMYQKPAMH